MGTLTAVGALMAADYWEKQATYWQRQANYHERRYEDLLDIAVGLCANDDGDPFTYETDDGDLVCWYCDMVLPHVRQHTPECPAGKAIVWVAQAVWDAKARAEVLATDDDEDSDTDEE